MGVAGLWEVIQHTSQTRSLTHLAVQDGFIANTSSLRGYRIGIDASIWFFHAKSGREGENPELRLIFFRLAKLLSEPFLPVFVFDGPGRPTWKRGIKISKKPHWMIHGVKTMIDAFGFEWHQAPGEAEAELAYLNRVNVIDGILSDDVDNFLFGALTVIRNPGRGLTGNISNPALNGEGKDDGNHVRIFEASKIAKDSELSLNRAGFILIGLLSGGDYEEKDLPGTKLPNCGIRTAVALARCGFGEELVNAFDVLPLSSFSDDYLPKWRNALKDELKTNSRGFLGRKMAKLANGVSDAFPNLNVLRAYVMPVISGSVDPHIGPSPPPTITWAREHSLSSLAHICEEKFEWGTMKIIPKRFRSLLWHGSVVRILRRAALDLDEGKTVAHAQSTEKPRTATPPNTAIPKTPTKRRVREEIGTPSKMIAKHFSAVSLRSPVKPTSTRHTLVPSASDDDDEHNHNDSNDADLKHVLISGIKSLTTSHPQTDNMLEYRVEIDPYQLVQLTRSGIDGIRDEPVSGSSSVDEDGDGDGDGDNAGKKTSKKGVVDSLSMHRVWLPGAMLAMVEPTLVSAFEEAEELKRAKKGGKGKANVTRAKSAPGVLPTSKVGKPSPKKIVPKVRHAGAIALSSDDEAEVFNIHDVPKVPESSGDEAHSSRIPAPALFDSSVETETSTNGQGKGSVPARHRPVIGSKTKSGPAQLESMRNSSTSGVTFTTKSVLSTATKTSTTIKGLAQPPALKQLASKPKPQKAIVVRGGKKLRDDDSDEWDDLFPVSRQTGATSLSATLKDAKRALIQSEDEELPPLSNLGQAASENPHLPKSPRKNREQQSPQRLPVPPPGRVKTYAPSRAIISDSEEDDCSVAEDEARPYSPSPSRRMARIPCTNTTTKFTASKVVDLSSSCSENEQQLYPKPKSAASKRNTSKKISPTSLFPLQQVVKANSGDSSLSTKAKERTLHKPNTGNVIDLTTP